MYKKVLAVILSLTMCLSISSTGFAAAKDENSDTGNVILNADSSEPKILYSGIDGDLDWSIDSEGLLTVSGTGDYSADSSVPGWTNYSSYIQSAVINISGITSTNKMFYGCSNMKTLDLTGFDTSNVTDMSCMFYNCSGLESMDISGFDTSNVKDMSCMFYACSNMKELDVSDFDTSNVTSMNMMFYGCGSVAFLDVSGFNTLNVTSMYKMFYGCSGVNVLDFSGFDISNLAYADQMFDGCNSLATVEIPAGFPIAVDLPYHDSYCWVDGDGTMCYTVITGLEEAVTYTRETVTLPVGGTDGDLTWNISEDGILTISGTGNYEDAIWSTKFGACVTSAKVQVSGITSVGSMFKGLSNMTSIDVSGLDTSEVTNMYAMFYGCSQLTELDLSNFDTSKVRLMSAMFSGCANLVTVDVSSFDMSVVQGCNELFAGCESLKSLDLSNFNFDRDRLEITSEAWDGTYLCISDCSDLETLIMPVGYWFSEKMPSVDGYYWKDSDGTICNATLKNQEKVLTYTKEEVTLPIEGTEGDLTWSISEDGFLMISGTGDYISGLKSYGMFYYTSPIWTEFSAYITGAKVNVSGITSTNRMFYGCDQLKSVDFSGVSDSAVTSMGYMFYGCSSLTNVDLSSLAISSERTYEYEYDIFTGCSSLVSLTAPAFSFYCAVELPEVDGCYWKDANGNLCKELRQDLDTEMTYTRYSYDVSFSSISLEEEVYVYDSTEKIPAVTVKDGTMTLTEGTDYTVSYNNNVNAGTATVTVTGTGDYTGTASQTFTINKADQTIAFDEDTVSLKVDEKIYVVLGWTAGTVTYFSSDTSVATISSTGEITAVGEGTAVITITADGNENYNEGSGSFSVIVTAAHSEDAGSSSSEDSSGDAGSEDGSGDTGSEDAGEDTGSADTEDSDGTSTADTLLVRRGNMFYVNYTLKGGNADMSFTYGRDTDEVLIGDWNGDGIDTICVRRGNRFYFSNTLGGQADFYIDFGRTTDEVVAGDWDGDGCDTICVRRGNHYYINNTLESGNAAIDFTFGRVDDEVLSGDWDGDGYDTLCIRRGNHYYINNTLEGGNAAIDFTFGRTGDSVLSGDWDADSCDTLCIRRGNHYYINNTLEGGNAAIDFTFGREGDEVYAGTWQ